MSDVAEVRSGWRDLAAALLALLAMSVLAQIVLAALTGGQPQDADGEILLGPAYAAQFAASLLVIFLAFRVGRPGPHGHGIGRAILQYLGFLVGFVPLAFVLLPMLWQELGLPLAPQAHLVWFLEDGTPLGFWLVGLATAALVGPVFEEVVFRGYLLRGLQTLMGSTAAIWISAGLFGLLHVDAGWFVVLPLSLLGALLGWFRVRYEGLAAPIAVHVLHNTWVLAVTLASPQLLEAAYRTGG